MGTYYNQKQSQQMRAHNQKMHGQLQKVSQYEYGMLSSHPTSATLRFKKIQRKRSPGILKPISKQRNLQIVSKGEPPSNSRIRFIHNKLEPQNNTNSKEQLSKQQQLKEDYKQNRRFQRSKRCNSQPLHQSFSFKSQMKAKCLANTQLKSGQNDHQKQYWRQSREIMLERQIELLQRKLWKINEEYRQQTIINQNMKQIVKVLQIKNKNLADILLEKQNIVEHKNNQILTLKEKIEILEQYKQNLHTSSQKKKNSQQSIFLDSSQRINIQNFIALNQKSHSALMDVSLQIDYAKIISGLNEKIKYQDIQIQMLKRSKQVLKYEILLRDKQIKIVNQKIRHILLNTVPRSSEENRRKCNDNQEDQDITFQISLD